MSEGALQSDGRVTVGGAFSAIGGQTRGALARLYADGSVDTSFVANANLTVTALAPQPDGKLFAGGTFTTIGGQTRRDIARLSTLESAMQSLRIVGYSKGGSVVTWTRSGAGPELALPPQVALASTTVGTMQRVANGWRYAGLVPPLGVDLNVSARGLISSGVSNGSSGVIESTLWAHLSGDDGVFTDGFE